MTKFRKSGVSDMEEYIQKLLYYLPIDFGDTENNEYKTYLVRACCENYTNDYSYLFGLSYRGCGEEA